MGDNYFTKTTGVLFTAPDFDRFLKEHLPNDGLKYLQARREMTEAALREGEGFIASGHHQACECGCQDQTLADRERFVKDVVESDSDKHLHDIDCYIDSLGDGLSVFTPDQYYGVESDMVLVAKGAIIRYQTDEEYNEDFDPDELIRRATHTEFDPSKHPGMSDDELDEMKWDFDGEPIDLSVDISEMDRKLLLQYGELKNRCVYS